MEKNNKTLLIAVLIMLLALVSLNFNNISGRAGSGNVVFRVTPTSIDVPGNLDLYVDTKGLNVDSRVYLYKSNGARTTISDKLCQASICKGVVKTQFFVDSRVEPGRYFLRLSQRGGGAANSHDSNMFSVI